MEKYPEFDYFETSENIAWIEVSKRTKSKIRTCLTIEIVPKGSSLEIIKYAKTVGGPPPHWQEDRQIVPLHEPDLFEQLDEIIKSFYDDFKNYKYPEVRYIS